MATKPPKRVFRNAQHDLVKAETAYASSLSPLAGAAISATDALVLRRLHRIVGDPAGNLKIGWLTDLERAFSDAYARTWRSYPPRRLAEAIRRARQRVERISLANATRAARKQQRRQKGEQRLTIARLETADIQSDSEQWNDRNSETSVGNVDRHFGRMSDRIRKGVIAGVAVAAIVESARTVDGQTRRAFANMAANETQNLNASYTQTRWEDAGVRRYRWITVGDDRVRPEHAERDGLIYAWDAPPPDGHPGEPFACRCESQPMISSFRATATQQSGTLAAIEAQGKAAAGISRKRVAEFRRSEIPALEQVIGERVAVSRAR